MSLWTPGGEHPVDRNQTSQPAGGGAEPQSGGPDILAGLSEEQRAEFARLSPEEQEQAKVLIAQMAETRQRMVETPAAVVVANHAMGLYELAAIHLGSESPKLDEAKMAVDALAGILDAVGDQMGEDGATLRDALAQIQLAYVQVKAATEQQAGGSN
jgi:hypothetical protein